MVDLVTGILFKRIRDGSFDIMCWEGAGGGGSGGENWGESVIDRNIYTPKVKKRNQNVWKNVFVED